MVRLLDELDAILLTAGDNGPNRPEFDVPEEYSHLESPSDVLQLVDTPGKGKGWTAKTPLVAGTVVMVSKPIAWTMDLEAYNDEDEMEDEEEDEGDEGVDGSKSNDHVVLRVLQRIKENPSIWFEQVSALYPRDNIGTLPTWNCKDDNILSQFGSLLRQIEGIPQLQGKSDEIRQRLPLIIRYNVLSIETCSELLSYPGPTGHSLLGGVGLFHLPSFFNHSPRPNVSRYAVGNIMWFVCNQDIPQGQEVCISYVEHDVLCENAKRRNAMLRMDFQEPEDGSGSTDHDGPPFPVVDSDVQMELMEMDPFQRMDAIDELMKQATGEALPEGERSEEDGMDAGGSAWFQCDIQNLRILKAITLESLGQSTRALGLWEECIQFSETNMPPNDESSIVVRVQAALCSWDVKDKDRARKHAAIALNTHNLMFGGGVNRFRRRYMKEFCLNLRKNKDSAETILWPLQ
ncbi:unnamed protein product [Cylindrotheca closterium]|uniref:SET domain-containing protein n=1 Tax=Cylindrotheca closterium TaxID=2856 RepID=A0AAD2G6R1_9STRA|nr:unnamed protein product [Cylindrotheca closterium]